MRETEIEIQTELSYYNNKGNISHEEILPRVMCQFIKVNMLLEGEYEEGTF